MSFSELINAYRVFLTQKKYPFPTFVDELMQFNLRRNRIVHQLWRRGFSSTNEQAEAAARAAVTMYGLLIEWFSTFDESIWDKGYNLNE